MKEQLVSLFETYENSAFLISILLNIVISVLGVVPSVFLTAANLAAFGFWKGTFVSFLGEAVGALVSFWIYRKGFQKAADAKLCSYPKGRKLLEAKGREAFFLILSLRLLPFVPSGVVTFVAAIGQTSWLIFLVASSLGKVPALLLEAYSVYQVMNWTWQGKAVMSMLSIFLLAFVWQKVKNNQT
ncbi:TVP38/TMEM64 family protein [Anoxybacteroides tepidamans]|uniref:TVP38/TMEM64 family protein n=1 Tax=Anoxybacteroides tepidamans TaxID=265948 RepID=UPI0004868184|nr:VTT domain-containing protein [Anoxybacillus tepidamans]